VSGDEATCEEVRAFQPDVEAVVTKETVSRTAAICKSPREVVRDLKSGMARAIEKATTGMKAPDVPASTRIEIELAGTGEAELSSWLPGAERIDGRTVALDAPDMPAAYRFFLLTQWLGYSLRIVQ